MSNMKEKELATMITDALNGSFYNKVFCEEMSKEHRFLQGEFSRLCFDWILYLSEMYDEGRYDGRNENFCRLGKDVAEYLKNK